MIDPLGVLSSTNAVVASSQHVRIDDDALNRLAGSLDLASSPPEWDADLHFRASGPDATEHTAMWILALDALNFCFWGQGDDPQQRWRIRWKGELVDGYVALVGALTRAGENGYPLHDAGWLSTISDDDVREILSPESGHTEIPLFDDRVRNLRELGAGLSGYSERPATSLLQEANGSTIALVRRIVELFPSFNDFATWPYAETGLPNHEVRFYKRAQILVGDLAGGLQGSPLVAFTDLDRLTAFADYKVPQMLRSLGVLVYDTELAELIALRRHIPAGSRLEMEIRAATIMACDRLVAALRRNGHTITTAELDWYLWSQSQRLSGLDHPYHLTPTVYY